MSVEPARKRAPRHRTLLGAQLVFNGGLSVFDCHVRDLSEGGAKLRLPSTVGVPNTFDLVVAKTEQTFHARVTWRTADGLGVVFKD